MPNIPAVGSQVKVYPRVASDPTLYVGRGTFVGESPNGLYMIRQQPTNQLRTFPVGSHTIMPNQNDEAAVPLPLLSAPNFSIGGRRRSRRHRRVNRRKGTRRTRYYFNQPY